jgi:hypothetical protein
MDASARTVVAFGSIEGQHMSGLQPYELHENGKPLFSTSGLYTIFQEHLNKNEKLPTKVNLKKLCDKLNYVAAMYHIGKYGSDLRKQRSQLHESLDFLHNFFVTLGAKEGGIEQRAFNLIVRIVNRIEFDPHGYTLSPTTIAVNWQGKRYSDHGFDVASYCASAIKEMLKEANHRQYGLSNEGPLARLVTVLSMIITGEQLTPSQVAQHLKRANRAKSTGTNSK